MSREQRPEDDSRQATNELSGEAAAWFARMHSDQVTTEDELAFSEWLDADQRRRVAYEEARGVWMDMGGLRNHPRMRELSRHLSPPISARGSNRRTILMAGGGAAAAICGLAGWTLLRPSQGFMTTFGEQRRVALEDGSTLTLNTESAVRVALNTRERRIWLDRGQAHFIVAPDPNRPFRVFVDKEEVRALGTRFEVRRQSGSMKVTLEEGSVAIFRGGETQVLEGAPASGAEAVLRPGQQAVVAARAINIEAVDTQRILAWRFGQMSLDASPLSEAIEEINRYNTRRIILDDARLEAVPISGLFQTGSPDAFAEAVSAVLPVEVVEGDDGNIHLRDPQGQPPPPL